VVRTNMRRLFWPVLTPVLIISVLLLLGSITDQWPYNRCYLAFAPGYFWVGLAYLLDFHPSKKARSWSKDYRRANGVLMLVFGVYWLLFYLELMVLPMLFVLFGLFLWVQSKKEEDI